MDAGWMPTLLYLLKNRSTKLLARRWRL